VARPVEVHQAQAVELVARTQVLAVDEAGNVTKVRLIVDRGAYAVKAGKDETLVKGDVLVCELRKDKRIAVTREKSPLSQEAADLLADALPYNNTLLSLKEDPTKFESAAPMKVNDSCPLDNQVLSELLPRRILLDKSILSGTLTLTGAVKYRGEPTLKVKVAMQIPHYTPTDGAAGGVVPRGFKFTDGSVDATIAALYPIDATKMPTKWNEVVRATATAVPDNHKGQATAATHATRQVDFTELAAGE
jgi:hypothetical protein